MQQPETVTQAPSSPSVSISHEKSWLTPGRFALLFGVLIFAAFPKVLLGLESFVIRDFGFFAYPLAHFQRECFWRGELPLWNPYNHCGVPFLAQWNTMPLYPPALVYLVLPLPWSLNFFCLLHVLWAGLGMYFLARRWTGSAAAAAVAGTVFGFNGFALNLLMWPSHIATYSWMPWVVLAVEKGWSLGGRKLLLGVAAGALQMLAGGPETILFTWVILSVLWVGRLVGWLREPDTQKGSRSPEPSRAALLWRFPAMVLLVACLAAAQLLPFLDLAAHSQREQGFADARWSMPSWGWANFLVPMVFGTTGKQDLFFQYGQYWTSSYYLGIGALLLALLALRAGQGRRVWLLTGVAVVGLVLATGDQTIFSRAARQILPQLSFMTYPVKYVTLVVFALPLLAAFGVSGLEKRATGGVSRRAIVAGATLLALTTIGILLWAWRYPFATDDVPATVRNGLSRLLLLFGAGGLLWFWAGALTVGSQFGSSNGRAAICLVLLALFWVDVRTHEPQQNPSVPGWVYTPGLARTKLQMNPQPELGVSRAMLSPDAEKRFRELVMDSPKDNFLVKRLGLFADCNLLDHIPTVNGFYSLAPRDCGELNSILYVSGYAFGNGLPDFLSVSQMSSARDYTAWEARTNFMPLATAGQFPVFLEDTNALGVLLSTNFNGREIVLLPPEAKEWVTVRTRTPATVKPIAIQASRVELEVEASEPSMVVLSQTYYHPWTVRVDGRPERLLRANFAFQAFQVPGGKHHVAVTYEDRAFRLGSMISCVALLLCAVGWFLFGKTTASGSQPAQRA